ncbi:hypothetical protein DL98DRAFT_650671 [Cadophora sp. DSE1049]|nr:hypothetical protein DL98DRAFT_650671 [Cadophora sp. DSE1049]
MAAQNNVVKSTDHSQRKERPVNQQLPKPNFAEPATQVTFLIGPDNDIMKFIVHKEFACYHSSVVRAAFSSNFVDGQTQTYRIEDTSAGAFRLLVQWLYTQRLKIVQWSDSGVFDGLAEEAEEDKACNGGDAHLLEKDMNLVRLWVLADRLGIPKLQNDVMAVIINIGKNAYQPQWETFRYIYESTAEGSPLRALATRQCVIDVLPHTLVKNPSAFPHQLPLDTAVHCAQYMRHQFEDKSIEAKDFFVDTSSV